MTSRLRHVFLLLVLTATLGFGQFANNFSYQIGGQTPDPVFYAINGGSIPVGVTVKTTGGAWLLASLSSPTTPSTLTISVNAVGLAIGTYSGVVTVTSGNALTWAITLIVTAAPVPSGTLSASPRPLTFTQSANSSAIPQSLNVTSSGAPMNYRASASSSGWLTVIASTPNVDGSWNGTTPSSVAVFASAMPAGIYTGTITLTSAQATNSPLLIPVTYVVGTPTLNASPASLTFSSLAGSNSPLSQAVNLSSSSSSLSYNASVANGTSWLSVSPASGQSLGQVTITVNPSGLGAGSYSSAINVTSAGGGALSIPVTLTVASPGPVILSGGVVGLNNSVNRIQAGSWITIYGTDLATTTSVWSNGAPFPTTLNGVNVSINGKPAYLWMVSPGQINLQAPDDSALGPVEVVLTRSGLRATATVTLAQVSPSFNLLDSKHIAGVIIRPNKTGAFGGGAYDVVGPLGTSLGYPTIPAAAGETLLLYGVGFGPTSPSVPAGLPYVGAAAATYPIQFVVNGKTIVPDWAGISSPGLFQFNITVPSGLGTGDQPIQAIVNGVSTPIGVVLALQ